LCVIEKNITKEIKKFLANKKIINSKNFQRACWLSLNFYVSQYFKKIYAVTTERTFLSQSKIAKQAYKLNKTALIRVIIKTISPLN